MHVSKTCVLNKCITLLIHVYTIWSTIPNSIFEPKNYKKANTRVHCELPVLRVTEKTMSSQTRAEVGGELSKTQHCIKVSCGFISAVMAYGIKTYVCMSGLLLKSELQHSCSNMNTMWRVDQTWVGDDEGDEGSDYQSSVWWLSWEIKKIKIKAAF